MSAPPTCAVAAAFSQLAAQMIGELIAGRSQPWFDDFAIDPETPKYL
jgi:hypothetical protein